MKVLALDTSQLQATVCLLEDGVCVKSATGSTSVAHSESLLELISGIVDSKTLAACDAFAVGIGPGSFTGIRIGCATIKAFAQIHEKKVIAFSSLKALIFSSFDSIQSDSDSRIIAIQPAYQGMVFVGMENELGQWNETAWTPQELIQTIKQIPDLNKVAFIGCGYEVFTEIFDEFFRNSKIAVSYQSQKFLEPIGMQRAVKDELKQGSGAFLHYNKVEANYIRASQAEIKLSAILAKTK